MRRCRNSCSADAKMSVRPAGTRVKDEDARIQFDVALVPRLVRTLGAAASIVVDELRSSSSIITLLDSGCDELLLAGSLTEARRLAGASGSLLIGEQNGRRPPGFDGNNSPVELSRTQLKGRGVVLCTTNGTAVLNRLQLMPAVLVGCLLNARACAEAALELAGPSPTQIEIVCAGQRGAFALDDAIAAGAILQRLIELAEVQQTGYRLGDAARATLGAIRSAYPEPVDALRASISGRILRALGGEEDIEFCAQVDSSRTVPVLRAGIPMRIERLDRARRPNVELNGIVNAARHSRRRPLLFPDPSASAADTR